MFLIFLFNFSRIFQFWQDPRTMLALPKPATLCKGLSDCSFSCCCLCQSARLKACNTSCGSFFMLNQSTANPPEKWRQRETQREQAYPVVFNKLHAICSSSSNLQHAALPLNLWQTGSCVELSLQSQMAMTTWAAGRRGREKEGGGAHTVAKRRMRLHVKCS